MEENESSVIVYSYIDELRRYVDEAKNSPFSKNKAVDSAEIFSILDNMKTALDDALQNAENIEREKETILREAKSEADEILQNARARAQELVTADSVTRSAVEQSQKILERTKQRANDMKRQAYQYCEGIFDDLQSFLRDNMEIVNENINRLNGRGDK